MTNQPAYTGAYVYGRCRTRRRVDPDGGVHSGITLLPRPEWAVCIQGHHAGYITWEDYLTNEAKLAANRTNAGAQPPREGLALCQGIIWCARVLGRCRPGITEENQAGRSRRRSSTWSASPIQQLA